MIRNSKALFLTSRATLLLATGLIGAGATAQSPDSLPEKIYACVGQDINDKFMMKATLFGSPGNIIAKNFSYDQGVYVPDSGFLNSWVKRGSDDPNDPVFTIGFTVHNGKATNYRDEIDQLRVNLSGLKYTPEQSRTHVMTRQSRRVLLGLIFPDDEQALWGSKLVEDAPPSPNMVSTKNYMLNSGTDFGGPKQQTIYYYFNLKKHKEFQIAIYDHRTLELDLQFSNLTESPGLDFYRPHAWVISPIESIDFDAVEKRAGELHTALNDRLVKGECPVYATRKPE